MTTTTNPANPGRHLHIILIAPRGGGPNVHRIRYPGDPQTYADICDQYDPAAVESYQCDKPDCRPAPEPRPLHPDVAAYLDGLPRWTLAEARAHFAMTAPDAAAIQCGMCSQPAHQGAERCPVLDAQAAAIAADAAEEAANAAALAAAMRPYCGVCGAALELTRAEAEEAVTSMELVKRPGGWALLYGCADCPAADVPKLDEPDQPFGDCLRCGQWRRLVKWVGWGSYCAPCAANA